MRHLTGMGTPRSLQGRVLGRPITHFSGSNGPLERLESALGALLERRSGLIRLFWASQIHH